MYQNTTYINLHKTKKKNLIQILKMYLQMSEQGLISIQQGKETLLLTSLKRQVRNGNPPGVA